MRIKGYCYIDVSGVFKFVPVMLKEAEVFKKKVAQPLSGFIYCSGSEVFIVTAYQFCLARSECCVVAFMK